MFRPLESLPVALEQALDGLRSQLASYPAVVVAYSGGVDSALVAAIAAEQLGERALAVTGVSPALAPHLREEARLQAAWMGIRQREIATRELEDPDYSSNPSDRCYACKRELHGRLGELLEQIALSGAGGESAASEAQVVDGVNHDDLGDHRPGIRAAQERGVRSPLAELGIDKAGVRQLSRALGFPWWDKPAQPCLASRFPYGESISAERLRRVGAAEAWLRQRGFRDLRVRSQGEVARIELPAASLGDALQQLAAAGLRAELVAAFLALGFQAVSLDLEGLVSGKLNRALRSPGPWPGESRGWRGGPGARPQAAPSRAGSRSAPSTEAGVSRRKLVSLWRADPSSSARVRQAFSGMVWSPQVKTSTAAYPDSGQVWIEMWDSANRARPVTPWGWKRWVIRLSRVAPARFAAVVMVSLRKASSSSFDGSQS